MSDFVEISMETADKPLLLVDSDERIVRLVSRDEVARIVAGAEPGNLACLLDLQRCLASLANVIGTDNCVLSMEQIGTITGLGYGIANHWVQQKILTASIRGGDGAGKGKDRLFSWRDGFIAGVVGSLRRQRVSLDMLRKVADLLRHPAPITTTPAEHRVPTETIDA